MEPISGSWQITTRKILAGFTNTSATAWQVRGEDWGSQGFPNSDGGFFQESQLLILRTEPEYLANLLAWLSVATQYLCLVGIQWVFSELPEQRIVAGKTWTLSGLHKHNMRRKVAAIAGRRRGCAV